MLYLLFLDRETYVHNLNSIWFYLKGIVSRDFEGLQMILMERIYVPDVPLEVYLFLNLHLHKFFNC